jgi:beta-carotene 3-hydroxylase
LWFIHKTHHQARKGLFELNDIFGIFFAIIAIGCFVQGITTDNSLIISIGVGITLYGFLYFFAHDIIVHQRVKMFAKSTNSYILALKKAHRIHHKTLTKKNAEEFGFLFVKKEYLQKSK